MQGRGSTEGCQPWRERRQGRDGGGQHTGVPRAVFGLPGGLYRLGGVLAHWGGGLELLWPWGSQDVAPDVALQLSVGVLGVPRSVLPMGGPLRSAPSTGGFGPPSAPPSCPCVWGSQQGLGGVPRSIPWGFLGSSALPFPLRCPVVSPHMGYGRPPVCPWRGGLGEGGVLRSVPLMGSWEWGGSPSLSLQ